MQIFYPCNDASASKECYNKTFLCQGRESNFLAYTCYYLLRDVVFSVVFVRVHVPLCLLVHSYCCILTSLIVMHSLIGVCKIL